MNRSDLAATWIALTNQLPGAGEVRLAPLDLTTPDGEVFAGRDGTGRRHLLLPVPYSTPIRIDRTSRGVHVLRSEFVVNDERRSFVDVVCNEPELNDLFERLTEEILERLTEEPSKATRLSTEVLGRWRDLLERGRPALGRDALAGLFGELWYLQKVVEFDPARRVQVWTGPSGARHDLEATTIALEVKTSTIREGRFVEVHGTHQLDSTEGLELFLGFARIEVDRAGESVEDLVRRLKELGADPFLLDQLVAQTGWNEQDADLSERFVVSDHDLYAVDGSFPRIVADSFSLGGLPPGVLRLQYVVDMTGPTPKPLDKDSASDVLRRLAMEP